MSNETAARMDNLLAHSVDCDLIHRCCRNLREINRCKSIAVDVGSSCPLCRRLGSFTGRHRGTFLRQPNGKVLHPCFLAGHRLRNWPGSDNTTTQEGNGQPAVKSIEPSEQTLIPRLSLKRE